MQEEGEPIRQHLLGHRLCPRGARRRCTLWTKPNLISLHKPASGSGNGKRLGWTSILPPAPRSSGCSAHSTTTTRLPVQAGSRMRLASPALSPCAQLTARHSSSGDGEPGDTRLPRTWCKLQPGAVNHWDLQRWLAIRDSRVTMAGKLQLSPQSHPASSPHIVPEIISNLNTMPPNDRF